MVVNHYGETGDFGEYGDFGELLSNRQMYVNQFHTWWPATHCFNVFSLFMQHLCWLKEQQIVYLSQIDNENRFQWSKTQHGHPVNKLLLNANTFNINNIWNYSIINYQQK